MMPIKSFFRISLSALLILITGCTTRTEIKLLGVENTTIKRSDFTPRFGANGRNADDPIEVHRVQFESDQNLRNWGEASAMITSLVIRVFECSSSPADGEIYIDFISVGCWEDAPASPSSNNRDLWYSHIEQSNEFIAVRLESKTPLCTAIHQANMLGTWLKSNVIRLEFDGE